MSNETFILGNGKFAVKENSILGYSITDVGKFNFREFGFYRDSPADTYNGVFSEQVNSHIARVRDGALFLELSSTNLLNNSGLVGGGAVPTNWTQPINTGTSTPTSSASSNYVAYTHSGTAQRPYFLHQSVINVSANATYVLSIYLESIVGSVAYNNILNFTGIGSLTGATLTYFRDGIAVSGGANAQSGKLSVVLSVASVGGNVNPRIGLGVSGPSTGTIVFSRPQFEIGNSPTSFILTPVGASGVRASEKIYRKNLFTSEIVSEIGGTWYIHLADNLALPKANDSGIWIGDNVTSPKSGNSLNLTNAGTSRYVIGKTENGTYTSLYTTTENETKIAIKWNGTNADIFVDGTKVISNTPFTFTFMENLLNGDGCPVTTLIKWMELYPEPKSDEYCINLTA